VRKRRCHGDCDQDDRENVQKLEHGLRPFNAAGTNATTLDRVASLSFAEKIRPKFGWFPDLVEPPYIVATYRRAAD
jgi:hypothetical protein